MSTVSHGSDSSAALAAPGSGEVEVAGAYVREEPVESTIRPTAFITLTVVILVIVAVSLAAIIAGGNFDGGQPGLTTHR
ncbi:hypothetical protein [Yinghuangia soli]|uniref:Uncharacterized protein n=1 Tax=Yinghuangia soli TaxID=2908204 RepID=A0AA41QBS5_9ACTN|nr:hypothetical protein [Yinghuangia soli]MCF2533979.1 hypothetical protein [Yinghuangia soli]